MSEYKKNEENLTVIIVNWYSMEFLEDLLSNLNDKAQYPEKIRYLVIDNTNGEDKNLQSLRETNSNLVIIPNDTKGEKGSFGHAAGLNLAMDKLETRYALVVDPDIHIFKNNWDTFCINMIESNGCSAVGATYPEWQLGKYHNYPNPVFCFFKTEDYKRINTDWSAYSRSALINCFNFCRRQILRLGILINRRKYQKHKAIRKIFKFLERIIGVCSNDTGSRIASKAKREKLKSILFEAILPEDIPEKNESLFNIAEHFELYCYNKEPIFTHRYGTASRVWKTEKGNDSNFWKQQIKLYEKRTSIE